MAARALRRGFPVVICGWFWYTGFIGSTVSEKRGEQTAMTEERINQSLSIGIPDGFRVMDRTELRQVFTADDPNRWGAWNREAHVMVTVLWKRYPLLLTMLTDLKAVRVRNEQLTAKGYAGHDYQRGEFFSLDVGGQPAEGYAFSYSVGDISQSAETVLIKRGKIIYSITCAGRTEQKAADHALFAEILGTIHD